MDEGISFDAEKYKQIQRAQWNETSTAWQRWEPVIQSWFGAITVRMLDLVQLKPGDHVLDIAAGAGEPGLSAAAQVGEQGTVLATDLSENMVQMAQRTADERGLKNFKARVMDGENLDLPDDTFDVVMCRLGLMLLPNQDRALAEWRRVLKPGGRAVAAVFSAPERNAWGAIPISIIRKRAQLPPPMPGQPGIFSLGGEGALDDALRSAGFKDIHIETISTPLRAKSAREAIGFAREAFGGFNQMMFHLPREERESIWDEVEGAMRVYEGPDGFEVPCEPLIGAGVK